MGFASRLFGNTRKPEGILGRFMVASMNSGHGKVSDWGISHLDADMKPGNILEIGCGGGRNAEALMKLYPKADLTAIDYSDVSVDKARSRNRKEVDQGRCSVMQADVGDMPLQDDYFDLATAFETVYFWPGPEQSFKEVYRVLRKGAPFMIVNESDGENPGDEKWCDIIDGMKIYSEEDLRRMLLSVGFTNVTAYHDRKNHWLSVIAVK